MNFIQALRDQKLFGPHFKGPSYASWKMVSKIISGVRITAKEKQLFTTISQRKTVPKELKELCLIIGRRGGKSKFAAALALYLACFKNWQKSLSVGERGIGMIICPDRRQGRVVRNYIAGFIKSSQLLHSMVEKIGPEQIDFKNNISIEIHTASYRSVRGYSVVFCILDELAFFRDENSANPDSEIINALKPAMLTLPESMLISLSTPYSRRGVVWDYFRHFGEDDKQTLVLNADTKTMNPSVSEKFIRDAYKEDPASAAAEYGAEFRKDIESFVHLENVEAVVIPGRHELQPNGDISYFAFTDPSGGSQDSFSLAISHKEHNNTAVLDVIREIVPPFSPESVAKEFAELLKHYRIRQVWGDRYAGEWPREQFRKHNIIYRVSEKAKSDIYRDLLPIINSRKCELLDDPKLFTQLANLERRTARGGRDSIDHPPGSHDDVVNAVAGAILLASAVKRKPLVGVGWGRDDPKPKKREKPIRHKWWEDLNHYTNIRRLKIDLVCYFCNVICRQYDGSKGDDWRAFREYKDAEDALWHDGNVCCPSCDRERKEERAEEQVAVNASQPSPAVTLQRAAELGLVGRGGRPCISVFPEYDHPKKK